MTLAYTPTPNGASSKIAQVMERMGAAMRFAKDEEIFFQDDDAELIYLLQSGAARTTRLLADGRRQVGGFYYAGDLVGFETGEVHRFSAEALTDCTVLVLKRRALKEFAGDDELERAIWEATRAELERAQDHLLVLGRKTACERVASFLRGVAERAPAERHALPMGRQDMADYLGLTIETVSRMLTQLQSSAVVSFESARQFRITSPQALERLAA